MMNNDMTIQEMIDVMTAFKNGEKVQYKEKGRNEWCDTNCPEWDWCCFEYRVKTEGKYRPYENTIEMIADYVARTENYYPSNTLSLIWVKSKKTDYQYLVNTFGTTVIQIGTLALDLKELFEDYTYLDGTPIGMKGEE